MTQKVSFPCQWPGCSKSRSRQRDLRYHVEADHKGGKPFKCRLCGEAFANKHKQRVHKKAVHIHSMKDALIEGKSLAESCTCKWQTCGMRFSSVQEMEDHFKTRHTRCISL